jgi:hypothetical protein
MMQPSLFFSSGKKQVIFCLFLIFAVIILAAYFITEKNKDDKAASEKEDLIISLVPDISRQDLDRYMAQDVYAVYGKTGTSNPNLAKILDSSRTRLTPYLYPDGPVCGYSVSYLGFIEIWLYEDMPVNRTTTDNIYQIIEASGKNFQEENIPVMFIRTSLPVPDKDNRHD